MFCVSVLLFRTMWKGMSIRAAFISFFPLHFRCLVQPIVGVAPWRNFQVDEYHLRAIKEAQKCDTEIEGQEVFWGLTCLCSTEEARDVTKNSLETRLWFGLALNPHRPRPRQCKDWLGLHDDSLRS